MYGEDAAQRLIVSIEASKERPAADLLRGLGIDGVGEVTAQALMERFESLAALVAATETEIAAAAGVSVKAARSIRRFFDDPTERTTLAVLADAGVRAAAGLPTLGAPSVPVADPDVDRLVKRIKRYAEAMKLTGLGSTTIRALVAESLLSGPADLYKLAARDLARLPTVRTFGAENARNLMAGIEASKERSLARLLFGLNIRHLGGAVGEFLADAFGHLDEIAGAPEERLAEVPGVGPTIAASVRAFFDDPDNRAVIEKLRAAGVNFAGPSPATADAGEALPATLAGRAVVVTGTLGNYSREEASAAIIARGGRSPGSVSGATTALVAGTSPGASKITRAEKLKIPILDEQEFEHLLATGELPSG